IGISPKGHTWKLRLNRENLSFSTMEPLTFSGDEPNYRAGFDWDSKNRIIGGGVHDGKFFAFDVKNQQWTAKTIRGAPVKAMYGYGMQYAPALNVFIFMTKDRTFAYRWE
ncbi:MAG: hypothetical protein ACPG4N_13495, partial [Gammaproteobacteria bacterium]